MNNTLSSLNNYLFEQLERLTDDSLTPEQLKQEVTRSKAVAQVSEQIINGSKLALKAIQYADEHLPSDAKLPPSTTRPLLSEPSQRQQGRKAALKSFLKPSTSPKCPRSTCTVSSRNLTRLHPRESFSQKRATCTLPSITVPATHGQKSLQISSRLSSGCLVHPATTPTDGP